MIKNKILLTQIKLFQHQLITIKTHLISNQITIMIPFPFLIQDSNDLSKPFLMIFLLCLSIAYAYNLSFIILQSHHFILSLLFSKYFFLTTIPDEGLSPKHGIIKIFSLNLHISHLDH